MPRGNRIDVPGALHHVIGRGIERREIFFDEQDREDFLQRLGGLLTKTGTCCYAWAIIPNHFHVLVKTGTVALSGIMGKLLTGYAVSFNRRHHRNGHLFQNRYKSILCQEDSYLLELVRYIHLNPLRAGLVADDKALESYPFCGHSAILGKYKREWQKTDYVLRFFGENKRYSRQKYREFVRKGISLGRRPDLIGGGLLRSHGGWTGLKALVGKEGYRKGDERILGDSAFVDEVLSEAKDGIEKKYRYRAEGYDIERIAERVGQVLGIDRSEVFARGGVRSRVQARSLLCYWASRELGISQSHLALELGLSQPGVTHAVKRGERIALEKQLSLIDTIKVNK